MTRRLSLFAVLLLLAGCTSASPPADQMVSPVQEQMFRHFALARDLRSLAVAGDLDGIAETAEELADSEETWGLPPGSDAYLAEVRAAARRAADATELEDASHAVAELAATCGTCHLANETDLGARLQTSAPYLGDPDIRHQNYLSWASRLLWDGLVGPSERTWSTGAGALADEDAYPRPAAEHVPEVANREAAETLREIGVRAVTAEDVETRTDLLARFWTTCAGCHTQAGIR